MVHSKSGGVQYAASNYRMQRGAVQSLFCPEAWGGKVEGRLWGYNIGVDYGKAEAQKEEAVQLKKRPVEQGQLEHSEQEVVQEEKTYEVKGSAMTTAYSLRLEALEVKGERLEFTGDAAGIFTPSANPLQRAKLRATDLQALRSRGTLFYFDFRPTRFEIRFYDPNNTASPLGVLHADAVPPAGNPACGSGKWSTLF